MNINRTWIIWIIGYICAWVAAKTGYVFPDAFPEWGADAIIILIGLGSQAVNMFKKKERQHPFEGVNVSAQRTDTFQSNK